MSFLESMELPKAPPSPKADGSGPDAAVPGTGGGASVGGSPVPSGGRSNHRTPRRRASMQPRSAHRASRSSARVRWREDATDSGAPSAKAGAGAASAPPASHGVLGGAAVTGSAAASGDAPLWEDGFVGVRRGSNVIASIGEVRRARRRGVPQAAAAVDASPSSARRRRQSAPASALSGYAAGARSRARPHVEGVGGRSPSTGDTGHAGAAAADATAATGGTPAATSSGGTVTGGVGRGAGFSSSSATVPADEPQSQAVDLLGVQCGGPGEFSW